MKAWSDLKKEVSLYWTGDAVDPDSYWYMDHGVKIEKFRDGHFELNNAMISGDFYKPLTSEQVRVFEEKGWLMGCYSVCIDTYSVRLFNVHKLLLINPENEDLIVRKNNIEKKLMRYLELADNLVI
jgi:hypothetical protein